MRALLAITVLQFATCCACGQEPLEAAHPKPVSWQQPFAAIPASQADRSLVLVLITNEDPFSKSDSAPRVERKNPTDNVTPAVWCADILELSYRQAMETRPDLSGRLTLQSIAAGMPAVLTGGDSRNAPARAVLALCDGNYRLLSLMVGVPELDDLLTLIEDAEDFAAMRQLHTGQPSAATDKIIERSSERLSRSWRGALQRMAAAMQGDDGDDDSAPERHHSFSHRLRLLHESYQPTYMADVRLRFGLNEASDQTRLILLEQHPEARRWWCDAMIPFVADSDFMQSWRSIVESIWGYQPITADAEAEELLEWYDVHCETGAVVLLLTPPLQQQHAVWPPMIDRGAKRGVGWQDVHNLALEFPFRSVDAQQLAVLMRSRNIHGVDIAQPSRARYLFVQHNKKLPAVIREGDPPGRFAGMLKRSKSSLVQN